MVTGTRHKRHMVLCSMEEKKLTGLLDLTGEILESYEIEPVYRCLHMSEFPAERFGRFPVTVYDSPIHGKGVFAIENISKGEVCTLYPCDAVIIGNMCTFRDGVIFENVDSYKFNLNKIYKISGNPNKWSNAYCGHMINDPSNNAQKIQSLNESTPHDKIMKTIIEYEIRCMNFENCEFKSGEYYCYIIATRDIQKGEELSSSYGWPYWVKWTVSDVIGTLQEYMKNIQDSKKHQFYKQLILRRFGAR